MRVEIQKPRENRDFTARGALARRISTRLKSLISHPSIREASFLAGFRACPPRERLHEKTGPFAIAAFSIAMLLWTAGEQYSGRELSTMLAEVGFIDIEVKPTWGYWSI